MNLEEKLEQLKKLKETVKMIRDGVEMFAEAKSWLIGIIHEDFVTGSLANPFNSETVPDIKADADSWYLESERLIEEKIQELKNEEALLDYEVTIRIRAPKKMRKSCVKDMIKVEQLESRITNFVGVTYHDE